MICHDTPGGQVAMRYHVRLWTEEGKIYTQVVLPLPVAQTILAGIENCGTNDTVEHIRTYRASETTTPELYSWSLE